MLYKCNFLTHPPLIPPTMPSTTDPQPSTSSASAPSPPSQTLIRDFFQSAMHIPTTGGATGGAVSADIPSLHPLPQPSLSPSLSLSSSDEEEMDTAENRKRRHQSDSPDDSTRPPGDGSLLTNTSMNPIRRTRLSTAEMSSPALTSTPDRVDIQMASIRGATAAVAPELHTISSDDEDISAPRD